MFRKRNEGHLEHGAAAVEMALVLPLLLLVLFGLVDFGRAFNAQMQLTQAAREGVRVVALGGTLADAQARAQLAMPLASGSTTAPTVTAAPVSVVCTSTGPADGLGRVTVTSTFTFLTPLGPIARVFGASTLPGVGDVKSISARGVMRCFG